MLFLVQRGMRPVFYIPVHKVSREWNWPHILKSVQQVNHSICLEGGVT